MLSWYIENSTSQLKRKMFDNSNFESGSSKKHNSKIKNSAKLGDQEVDSDFAWFLDNLPETQKEALGYVNENENENENEIEKENENENEIEKEKEDEDDKDPRYCMFLEKLTENGRSYMLKVSQNNMPLLVKYEEEEESDGFDDHQTCIDNTGDKVTSFEDMDDIQINQSDNRRLHGEISTMKEVSRRKKMNKYKTMNVPHQGITPDSCYQLLLNGIISSDYGAFKYEGKLVKYEDEVTSSDSDIKILDNDQDFSEVNNKDSSLREKLIRILEKPYSHEEYEEHIKTVRQDKAICRILDLRGRPISSALDRVKKSLLDYSPRCFKKKLQDADGEPFKELNLLRMFLFWLKHIPDEEIFEPWLDKKILEVLPNKAGVDVINPPDFE